MNAGIIESVEGSIAGLPNGGVVTTVGGRSYMSDHRTQLITHVQSAHVSRPDMLRYIQLSSHCDGATILPSHQIESFKLDTKH